MSFAFRYAAWNVKQYGKVHQFVFPERGKNRKMKIGRAFQKALNQAKEIFNICPICKRLVCDHCFLICDDLDMCVQCAAKLNEKGTVVG